jgi:diaminohydroxyphosphoribosylaminopyrimidine deaminase/5-amino-6-(5-phosphoribosylamino)uracil reductase
MGIAIEQAQLCPLSEGAFSVGAVIVGQDGQDGQDGQEISRGYSREGNPYYHGEGWCVPGPRALSAPDSASHAGRHRAASAGPAVG